MRQRKQDLCVKITTIVLLLQTWDHWHHVVSKKLSPDSNFNVLKNIIQIQYNTNMFIPPFIQFLHPYNMPVVNQKLKNNNAN